MMASIIFWDICNIICFLLLFQITHGLFGVDELPDGGALAADGAFLIMPEGDGSERHGLGVEREQGIGQERSDSCDEFQALRRLDRPQDSCDCTQNSRLGTGGDQSRR